MSTPEFEIGRIYDRQRDLHGPFGGQAQGGISTPAEQPFLFLFTGETGQQYGYKDGWSRDNVFLYTGEGQTGDMDFIRGNKAIRDHVPNGKDLFLFEALGKGKGYRHLGQFICTTWEFRQGPDLQGKDRKVIVFHLVQPGPEAAEELDVEDELKGLTLRQLREKALQAATAAPQTSAKTARRTYYERSAAVKAYVLARANGTCECCGRAAPFLRADETPYLEPHHTRRLSDGGPDDPRWVAGICPNCHRCIHHGKNGAAQNVKLQGHLAELESRVDG